MTGMQSFIPIGRMYYFCAANVVALEDFGEAAGPWQSTRTASTPGHARLSLAK